VRLRLLSLSRPFPYSCLRLEQEPFIGVRLTLCWPGYQANEGKLQFFDHGLSEDQDRERAGRSGHSRLASTASSGPGPCCAMLFAVMAEVVGLRCVILSRPAEQPLFDLIRRLCWELSEIGDSRC